MRVAGRLSRDALFRWQSVCDQLPVWLKISCIDESEDSIAPGVARDGERVRLTVNFEPIEGAVHLFTLEGWRSFLLNDDLVTPAAVVRLAFSENPFATKGFIVEPWNGDPKGNEFVTQTPVAGPRRQVRCHSAEFMAPSRIEPWITVTKPNAEDVAWREWRRIAMEMIARSLPSELFVEAGVRRVALSGQPPRRLNFGELDESCSFQLLQDAADWVYLEGTDNEVRHTFLTAELTREWPADASFFREISGRVSLALDSARLLYKAHLRSGSKDTLKALADLRKSLADDVQKLIQQARDLSNAIWRDVALAIGVLAIRLAMDPAKTAATSKPFAIIFLVVAIYVGVSFWIAISTNDQFFKKFDDTRSAWRPKLYAFLDNGDYKSLADDPINGAIATYRSTERKIAVVVAVVVIVLLILACMEAGFFSLDDVRTFLAGVWAKAIVFWHAVLAWLHL